MTITLDASQHLIKAITIFSSHKAEIVRNFTVELDEGQNDVAITSLPSCIDIDSARVTGLGDAVLFDIVCTVDDARDTEVKNTDLLDALERRRATLDSEKAIQGKAADILVQYGRSLSAEHVDTRTVESFLDSLVYRGSITLADIEAFDKQIAELDKEIEQEKRRLQKKREKAATRGRVTAVIMAKRAGKVEVSLTYMVSNATWSPSYDLCATTEDGKPSGTVSLHYRASIKQNTGEDWRDTAVSVSTAMPGSWSTIPALRSMKISPVAPIHSRKPMARMALLQQQRPAPVVVAQASPHAVPPPPPAPAGLFGMSARRSRSISRSPDRARGGSSPTFVTLGGGGSDDWTSLDPKGEPIPDEPEGLDGRAGAWTETKAVVTESAVSSSFRIEGKCTIPSEPTAHKVAIAILTFDAKVNYITVPRSTPIAFLQCEVKNTSEYRLLGGSVQVFLDDSPVSKTHIKDVNREEAFKCTLGPDPSLRVKYTRLPRVVASSGSAFAAQMRVTTYKLFTAVQNAHTFPVKGITVRDAAPDAGQSSKDSTAPGIRVVIKQPEGLGEAESGQLVDVPKASSSETCSVKVRWEEGGGEEEGRYEWIVDLGPGEEVKLEAEYEIRAPADFTWQLSEDIFH